MEEANKNGLDLEETGEDIDAEKQNEDIFLNLVFIFGFLIDCTLL